MTDPCIYPDLGVTLAIISKDIEHIKEAQSDIRQDQKNTIAVLFGNGKKGLKTEINSNRDAIKRIWWFFGITVTVMVGILLKNILL